MQVATGKSILGGVAIGPLRVYRKEETQTAAASSLTVEEELARFDAAREKAKEQLRALYDKALEEVGEENAAIFEIHQMMLEDDDYIDAVKSIVENQGATAEYAVATTGDNFAAAFADMEDAYMKARATDVRDVSGRVVNILSGAEEQDALGDEPAILVADDLTPSETVQMDKSKLLGFITRYGSANSHTAILARTMNIPALIGVDYDESWDGKLAVLDGLKKCDLLVIDDIGASGGHGGQAQGRSQAGGSASGAEEEAQRHPGRPRGEGIRQHRQRRGRGAGAPERRRRHRPVPQ